MRSLAVGVLLAWALFLLHASLYGGWLLDDAGISFAYARSLATGHGLVAQPGQPPVEGYSNPLWVLACSALIRLGAFPVPAGPKLLGAFLVLACYGAVASAMTRGGRAGRGAMLVALFACSMVPAFVAWAVSGLENPLYASLLALHLFLAQRALEAEAGPDAPALAACGLVAVLLALTRPDGLAFVFLLPAMWVVGEGRPARRLAPFLGVVVVLLATGLGLRLAYFGDPLPNTAYAKQGLAGDRLAAILAPATQVPRLAALATSVLGDGLGAIVLALGALAVLAGEPRTPARRAGWHALWMAGIYLVLPPDGYPEFRFATPLYPLLLAASAAGLGEWVAGRGLRRPGLVLLLLAAATFLGSFQDARVRALGFSTRPPMPLEYVRRAWVERLEAVADRLGIRTGSVMLADVGAVLYGSRFRVFDMAGLTDRVVGRAIGPRDTARLRDYVLEEVRPTFLIPRGAWARTYALASDPRFAAAYLPIHPFPPEQDPVGAAVGSGVYVRRDAVEGKRRELEEVAGWAWEDSNFAPLPAGALREWLLDCPALGRIDPAAFRGQPPRAPPGT